MSFYAKLRFITRNGTENLYIAESQQFLRVINGDADVLRLAVCKLYPAKYGIPGMHATQDIMTASLNNQAALEVLAVDISELDTKLVTAKEDSNYKLQLYGMVFCNTFGMA